MLSVHAPGAHDEATFDAAILGTRAGVGGSSRTVGPRFPLATRGPTEHDARPDVAAGYNGAR